MTETAVENDLTILKIFTDEILDFLATQKDTVGQCHYRLKRLVLSSESNGSHTTDVVNQEMWFAYTDTLRTQLSSLPSYNAFYRICLKFKDEDLLSYYLEQYVEYLVNKNIQKEQAEVVAELFLEEIQPFAKHYVVKNWLSGYELAEDRIQLVDGITIRKLEKEDFQQAYDSMMPYPTISNFNPVYRIGKTKAIIEFEIHNQERKEVQQGATQKGKRIIEALQLCKLVSARRQGQLFIPTKLLPDRGIPNLSKDNDLLPAYTSVFTKDDIATFNKIYTDIVPNLHHTSPNSLNEAIDIAFERYQEALSTAIKLENRITILMNALEALFLTGETELSHRLGQRVAKLLGTKALYQPIEVYRSVKDAYKIRSSYIHGSTSRNGSIDQKSLCLEVTNYVRFSILLMVQIAQVTDKASLLSLLDNSLIDIEYHHQLTAMVENYYITNL